VPLGAKAIGIEAVPCENFGTAFTSLGSRARYERFSNFDSELPVSPVELIAVSVFTALTSPPSLSKMGETLPRASAKRSRGNSVQNHESRIRASDVKKMQDSGPGTRFYSA